MNDYQLGQQIRRLIADRSEDLFNPVLVLSFVQDLLGDDTTLLLPIRDLLTRPSLRALVALQTGSARAAARDALLTDLLNTYQAPLVQRLRTVIDGIIELQPGVQSSSADAPPERSPRQSNLQTESQPKPADQKGRPRNGGPLLPLALVLVSVVCGVLIAALAWLLLSGRQPGISRSDPQPTTTTPGMATKKAPGPTSDSGPIELSKQPSSDPGTPWGDASAYKYQRVPGEEYPQNCAFSRSDQQGVNVTELNRMEYWACRDLGGSPVQGYQVRWADGEITTYRFLSDGIGFVTGTKGETYPVQWRNSTHQSSPIVIIEHQDKGQSWIPGEVEGGKPRE